MVGQRSVGVIVKNQSKTKGYSEIKKTNHGTNSVRQQEVLATNTERVEKRQAERKFALKLNSNPKYLLTL